jgi:hypothetical protein
VIVGMVAGATAELSFGAASGAAPFLTCSIWR